MTQNRITPYLDAYDPYGDTSADAEAVDDPAGPPASAFDRFRVVYEPDVHHARCRDCSPRLGRWVQADPVGYVEGVNQLPYVPADASADAPASAPAPSGGDCT